MMLEEKVFIVICIPFLLLLLVFEIITKNILRLRNSHKRSELKRMIFEYMNSVRRKNQRWKFYIIEIMNNIMRPSYFSKLKVQVELNELIKEGKVVVFNSGCSILYMLKEDAEIAIKYRNEMIKSVCQTVRFRV